MAAVPDPDQLIADYAAAVARERSAWHVLSQPGLSEPQKAQAYSDWKKAAATSRSLAIEWRRASGRRGGASAT